MHIQAFMTGGILFLCLFRKSYILQSDKVSLSSAGE